MRTALLAFLIVISAIPAGAEIVVNEIQAAPEGDEPEWIELYNFSDSTFFTSGLLVEDAKSSKSIGELTAGPGQYIIITSDSGAFRQVWTVPDTTLIIEANLPVFNNSWDNVVVRYADSILIDSVYYNYSWGMKPCSFERADPMLPALSPENLRPCIALEKATPGRKNSVTYISGFGSGIMASPNPFSPFSKGKDSECIIEYEIDYGKISYKALIFDTKGTEVRKLASGKTAFGKGMLVWDGRNEEGFPLPVGPYVLLFEAVDLESGKVFRDKILLVIGN